MIVSGQGLELIKKHEALRLNAYRDPVGIWTIGYGHTATAKEGQTIDEREADKLLKADVGFAEDAVTRHVKAPLNQTQFDSLVSFVFNIGESQFSRSTLVRVLNERDYYAVPQELARWNRDNGKRVKGLVRRRLAEGTNWINA